MAITRIKAMTMLNESSLMIIKEDNYAEVLAEPGVVSKLLDKGSKFFYENPQGILEVDLEDLSEIKYFTKDNIEIKYDAPTEKIVEINVDKTRLQIDPKSLSKYFIYARQNNTISNFTNFLERISNIEDVQHVSDLLEFLEKNNLPITKSGNLLGYKALAYDSDTGDYVDGHTAVIHQDVGTRVAMNPKDVTFDKNVHCSYGLHVATMNYAHNFMTDGVVFLVQIRPEDVISVPSDTRDKMRVSAYEIVAKLPEDSYGYIIRNEINNEVKEIIRKAINEEYPKYTKEIFCKTKEVSSADDLKIKLINLGPGEKIEKKKTKPKKIKEVLVKNIDTNKITVSPTSSLEIANIRQLVTKFTSGEADIQDCIQIFNYYKEHKKTISWDDLGIDNKLRKRILRKAGVYKK